MDYTSDSQVFIRKKDLPKKKKVKKCLTCSVLISLKAKYCYSCSDERRRQRVRAYNKTWGIDKSDSFVIKEK